MTPDEWEAVAAKRIQNILRIRRIASKRQLEIKISEAGPPAMRANPHHFSKALSALMESNQVISASSVSIGIGQPTPLYALPDWNPLSSSDSARIQRISAAYQDYLRISQNEDNGESFQEIVQRAIEQSRQFTWLNEPGKSPPNGSTISGHPITGSGDLDHYLIWNASASISVGVEDKSYREWIYPDHPIIKPLLRKCQVYNMLPVLVARKIHYTTRLFFHYLGAIAFETHFQYFAPKFAARLEEARHKDGLGFADIRFSDEAPVHVINLFSTLFPQLATASWEKFQAHQELVTDYVNDDLDYYHLIGELGIVELQEDDQYEEYDFPDF